MDVHMILKGVLTDYEILSQEQVQQLVVADVDAYNKAVQHTLETIHGVQDTKENKDRQ